MMLKTDEVNFRELNSITVSNNYANDIYEIEKECFSEPWSLKGIKDTIDNENSYFVVCELGNSIIGYAGMYVVCDEGYVYNIAVKKMYRNFGIGKTLLNKLLIHCNDKGLKFLSLEVRQTNLAAMNLYRKYEFLKVGIRKNFYSFPQEDAVIMTKYFKDNGDVILYENTSNRDVV